MSLFADKRIMLNLQLKKLVSGLAIASCNIACFCKVERDREKARLITALAKINFVGVLELLNDLLW